MDKIEEVKKILYPRYFKDEGFANVVAAQICQRFEPKPDESRLIPPHELQAMYEKWLAKVEDLASLGCGAHEGFGEMARRTQDAKTASIKDAKCQLRIERILEAITEDFVEPVANFYMNDKDRQRAFELWKSIKQQALKKQEGV